MAKIRVQDDLYLHVNQDWIEKAVIPDDKPMAGGFSDLAKDLEELMIKEFNLLSKGKLVTDDENMLKAVELFKVAKNVKKRNNNGLKPVMKTLKKIEKLNSIANLNRNLKEFVLDNIQLPFGLEVETDMKDTNNHAVMIAGPKVILPDTTYYKEGMEQQKAGLLGIWSNMAKSLLALTDLSSEDQEVYLADTLKFDEMLSALVKSSEEWSEYVKMYNPMPLRKISSLLKPLNFKKLIVSLFGEVTVEQVIVAEPRYFEAFKTIFNEDTFMLYKHWAYVLELVSSTDLLSEDLRELGSTYSKVLSGVAELPSIEKQAYNIASNTFSEPVGLYYGRKYFGEEAKKDVVEIVKEIINTYKDRINKNSILTDTTKEKAIVKLNKMEIKMGYPDKADEIYDKLVFSSRDNLYKIMCDLRRIRVEENIAKLSKPVNRSKWVMAGHIVNACYNPFTNDITFPAAILQAPFYALSQSRSANLGGIGAVIGHEISHAFDNNGALCDENGNINNWWTKKDLAKFNSKTKAMIEEFDGIELEWGKVNGAFIVSENIADNGGMAVTLDIMSHMDKPNYEEYFFNWARVWCMKARPEILKLLLSVDVHAPAVLRANMQPRNFPEWYNTFKVTKEDKMYIEPKKRVVIW